MQGKPRAAWREALYRVIFESDTTAGRRFDTVLLLLIAASVVAVVLESVQSVEEQWGGVLRAFEWTVTIIFTAEYLARLVSARRPGAYARSFLGVVDLLALLPTYLSLILIGGHSLLVIRALRLLRAFRVLKLTRYTGEANELAAAMRASRPKITVFMVTVGTIVVVVGALMYLVEGPENEGFSSIPASMYFAVVTLTTLGFGDVTPRTDLGRFLTAVVSLLGYAIIAVPTGIVTAEMSHARSTRSGIVSCPSCGAFGHDSDARFCKYCSAQL